ncbi:phosphotransferase family protein [Mycolicibacterium sp. P9-64]|uniref:phosphotransferase family protein n=1 Tax=Mycolicibacterium sp. P9-64 TaxID=2024612 RepID=UPI0011EC9F9E|nr:phosphotransferase family protein [Mycolicibacterium sp. P9-64]KAA0085586.1 phosphotransferase family protein [Mycolicibacterium sp. P9-64]
MNPSAKTGDTTSVVGLDLAALRAWLDTTCPGLVGGPLTASVLAGGKSNLTYRVSDGQHGWVVRRPPLGHVLATAHDMGREYRVMAALAGTAVPVPAMVAHCGDLSVTGAPFYVMEFVDGTVYSEAQQLIAAGAEATSAIAARMITTLADLHSLDPRTIGLEDLGRPDGYLQRQVARWTRQLQASRSRELSHADTLIDVLHRLMPPSSAAALVHGDYRLDNLLMNGTAVRAVIDWEMATLGDPLTDLALLIVYGRLPSLVTVPGLPDVSAAPGYPSEADLLTSYAAHSGRDLRSMDFHLALACFKLAVILEGIHYRHTQGHTVGEGFGSVGAAVGPLLEAGVREFSSDSKDY